MNSSVIKPVATPDTGVVYQTEGEPAKLPIEPLDDIVVVKPVRRKSKSLQRSQSQLPADTPQPPSPNTSGTNSAETICVRNLSVKMTKWNLFAMDTPIGDQ